MNKLKTAILAKYTSIKEFSTVSGITYNTLLLYCKGTRDINDISVLLLSNLCAALDALPEDIGYSKKYLSSISEDGKLEKIKRLQN